MADIDKTRMGKPVKQETKKGKGASSKLPTSPYIEKIMKQDEERIQKIREFQALPPDEKIAELERRVYEERLRASIAENALLEFKEKIHNEILHRDSNIENLSGQVYRLKAALHEANAKNTELEKRLAAMEQRLAERT
jgi:predicted RNase H-like nuclease (RuvC/YqgF family)